MFYNVAMFESPVQWMFVLVIALIVFGPKRLPEIGKQLGSALRELKKATGDMARTFNTDYEPDPEPYQYPATPDYASETTYYEGSATTSPDLTDYTIVGVTKSESIQESDPYALAPAHTVARDSAGFVPETMDDHSALSTEPHPSNGTADSGAVATAAPAGASDMASGKGEHNV